MDYTVSYCTVAEKLPQSWDEIVDCHFQTRQFFSYSELHNPCSQRYFMLYEGDVLRACACVYTLKINLLTFLKMKSPIKMQVIGVPATISPAGIFGKPVFVSILLNKILQKEKGLVLAMNLLPQIDCGPAVAMRTMPTIQFNNTFYSYRGYTDALRSDYRRRLMKGLSKFYKVETIIGNCDRFDDEYYELYLQVMKRTQTPLEVLSLDYFKNLPEGFLLTSYHYDKDILAWSITKVDGSVLYFFFGGNNYRLNNKFCSYYNNLQGIVKEAIEKGCKLVELGQTAEIPKIRLGGIPVELNLCVYHKNFFVLRLLIFARRVLEYRKRFPVARVFKSPP